MNILASQQPLASAYFVFFGHYGDVTQYAHRRGVSRQWVYHEANQLQQTLVEQHQRLQRLQHQVSELLQQKAALEQRLAVAVVLDEEKQAEFASASEAEGVSLPTCW